MRAGAALLLLLCLLPLAGCGGQGERWNVVMILADTLRASNLALYGHDRPTTPFLERLATESVVFEEARSQAGCTFPSVNSILTSRYPQRFLGSRKEHGLGIPPETPSLAPILRQRGYATAAVSASPIVRRTPSSFNPRGGFDAGFDDFHEECLGRPGRCVNAAARELLDGFEEPFFLYLHYLDPHRPYRPPEDHERSFVPDLEVPPWVESGRLEPVKKMRYAGGRPVEFTREHRDYAEALYDEEILYLDGVLRRLFEDLERRGFLDRTLVVFLSDHGEELWEHGHLFHCRDLAYDTLVRTPLMMRLPEGPRGVRRRAPVANLDVVPTVLDYLGVEPEDFPFEGRSLRPLIERDRGVHRVTFSQQGVARMVFDGEHKLILDLDTGGRRLFHIPSDPGEQLDLAGVRPEVADRLEEVVRRWVEAVEGDISTEESVRRARELREELTALGYL